MSVPIGLACFSALLFNHFGRDHLRRIALPVAFREFVVAEFAIAIVGIVKVMPEIHAVEGTNEPAPRDDIGADKRVGLVGLLHELRAAGVFDEPRLQTKIAELLCDNGDVRGAFSCVALRAELAVLDES